MSKVIEKIESLTGQYVVIRSYASGVHFGVLASYDVNNRHVHLSNSRRIWNWQGAFTLSAVATDGIKGGKLSKFIDDMIISQVEEIIPCSKEAIACLLEFSA